MFLRTHCQSKMRMSLLQSRSPMTPTFASGRGAALRTVAGRAAKQKQDRKIAQESEANHAGSKTSSKNSASNSQQAGQQNPLLPDDPVGSLNEFSSPSQPTDQASNLVEEVSKGPTATTYAIWITVLIAAIGVFYGLVFAASGGLSNFLKDKVTFTRKDFVPYSERRRLEDNLKASRQERQEAERSGDESSAGPANPSQPSPQSEGLFNLMPAPPLKK